MREWSLNKRVRAGDEFQACGHKLRVLVINKPGDSYNLCEVEDIGALDNWPTAGQTAPPLRFKGVAL